MSTSDPRVLVAADEPLYGKGLRLLLEASGLRSLYIGSAERALRLADPARREVLLWSTDGLSRERLERARDFRARSPRWGVCLLANGADPQALAALLESGTAGIAVVVRGSCPDIAEVATCVTRVAEGKGYVEAGLIDEVLRAGGSDPFAGLTPAEREVLALVAQGLRNREIARRLWKSEKAIEKSIARVFNKLGLDYGAHAHLDRRVVAASLFLRREPLAAAPVMAGPVNH